MGRMLRNADWNGGVLPSPFPDNGLEIDGTHWFGEAGALDYALYGVAGFRATGSNVTDINFAESHETFYVDNNARPAGGARLALTLKPTKLSDISLGASGVAGTYDDENKLLYIILGADFSVRVKRTNFRLEYLVRRTAFDTGNPAVFKVTAPSPPVQGDYFTKHGAYVELGSSRWRKTSTSSRASTVWPGSATSLRRPSTSRTEVRCFARPLGSLMRSNATYV